MSERDSVIKQITLYEKLILKFRSISNSLFDYYNRCETIEWVNIYIEIRAVGRIRRIINEIIELLHQILVTYSSKQIESTQRKLNVLRDFYVSTKQTLKCLKL
jgi:hypothetical protein